MESDSSKRTLLECKKLSFLYDKDLVLENINFSIKEGDFIAIIGPNGGGKSTLAKLLLGLLTPTWGEIIYPNENFFNANSLIGYTPQDTSVNKDFPIQAMDVVLMGFLDKKIWGYKITKQDKEKAIEIMHKLNICHLAYRKIGTLSGGQRQRVLIARAMCGDPKLLILDEPTSNIDLPTQKEIYELLKEINLTHTILVISHDVSILLECASKVLFVNKEVYTHSMKTNSLNLDGHFCEVEAINEYISKG